MEATKNCRLCGEDKTLDQFPNHHLTKTRRNTYCRPCESERVREWRRKNKDRLKVTDWEKHIRRKYKIEPGEYHEILKRQGGGCGICGIENEVHGSRLAVDHDHITGDVRGVLCTACNRALERFDKVPDWDIRAKVYLNKKS